MKKIIGPFSLLIMLYSCSSNNHKEGTTNKDKEAVSVNSKNLLTDYEPLCADGDIRVVVEIPTGTIEKWEVDKLDGEVKLEFIDQKPRIINYLGYPGNYGMVPRTLLSKAVGGDGDPLDVIVFGPPVERGSVVTCKLIGVLFLLDRNEQDDKLIAVIEDTPLYEVNSLEELDSNYNGITEIVRLWFANYKGPDKMEFKGFGDKAAAEKLLHTAIEGYKKKQGKNDS